MTCGVSCVLDGPVVTPPRASQRLHKQKMKAGAKRPASEAGLSSMPKKILRGQTQKQYVTMATNHQGGYIVACSLKVFSYETVL